MRCMAYCDLCDMDREFCAHGLADRRRNVVVSVSKLLISPNGIAHFPGCPHKGDHQDYRKWADLEAARAWERRAAAGDRRPKPRLDRESQVPGLRQPRSVVTWLGRKDLRPVRAAISGKSVEFRRQFIYGGADRPTWR
jgi:hypothetical protein